LDYVVTPERVVSCRWWVVGFPFSVIRCGLWNFCLNSNFQWYTKNSCWAGSGKLEAGSFWPRMHGFD
jgi:hypothetical protein